MNDLRERVRPADWPKSGWYWHLHHDRLIEWTDDIDERWDYVVREKSEEELPIRLHLMAPVRGQLPAELSRARAELSKAVADPAIIALHAIECPGCPWNGATIFPDHPE
jgi:hypothetical protein